MVVSTAGAPELLTTLYHGTDRGSAEDILQNGFSMDKAAQLGGGDVFWTTTSPEDAGWFAASNPAGGDPVILEIAVPNSVIERFLAANLLAIDGAVHQFSSAAMDELNSTANVKLMAQS